MALDLMHELSHYEPVDDRENDIAFFRVHRPELGSAAYLHVIYKAPNPDSLRKVAENLRLPQEFSSFLQKQNGANLFSNSLYLFGIVPKGQMLNRKDPFSLPPFDLQWENDNLDGVDRERFLAIGGYGFDGSTTFIDRSNDQVVALPRGESKLLASWSHFSIWIRAEIDRLSALFSSRGERLVNESETVPYIRHRPI